MDYYNCERCVKRFDEFEMDFKAAQIDKNCLCPECRNKYAISTALAIELTKTHLVNGQDETPKSFNRLDAGSVKVILSDDRVLWFNRVEAEHARLMLKKGEKNES